LADISASYQRMPRNMRGALWMLVSALTFTVMTLLIKLLGGDYPATLQTFYRQSAGLLILAPIILRDPRGAFATTRPGILIFRSLAGTVGMILSFYAYQEMPLAEANALSFTRTLWLVPLALFVLREPIGPRRISATLVGFLGVMLMLRPSVQAHIGWPAVAALVAAFLLATTITGMKVMTRDHSTTTLMVWSAGLGFLLAIPPAIFVWKWPTPVDLLLLSAMGALGTVTQACYIKGMSEGDAAAMAPMDYTRLVFAVTFGYFWFGEVPNALTMIGAGVVIGSTLYITIREMQVAARQQQAVPEPATGEL
jgi:drug/metabolite transporter (DMT)-like permease